MAKISDLKAVGKLKGNFCSDLIHGQREKPSMYALQLMSPCNNQHIITCPGYDFYHTDPTRH